MALINCPECNKEVSDKAASCPNCGIAIKQTKLQSLIDAGKKQLPTVQNTGIKYLKKLQETGQKHISSIQEQFSNEPKKNQHLNSNEADNFITEQQTNSSPMPKDDVQEQVHEYGSQEVPDINAEPKVNTQSYNEEPTKSYQNVSQTGNLSSPKAETESPIDIAKKFLSKKNNKIIATGIGVLLVICIISLASSSGRNKNPSPTQQSNPPPAQDIINTPAPTPKPTPQQTPEPPPPLEEVNTGILIEYDKNILMNIYSIRISVNDVPIGVLEQGETKLFELVLTEEVHTISFSEFGNDENITADVFEVTADSYNYFFIKTRNSGIEIEKRDIMTQDEVLFIIGEPGDETMDTPEPAATPDPTPIPQPTPEVSREILTRENNDDFAILLETYFPTKREIESFVNKYNGRTIEFDGHIFMSSRQFHGMRETPPTSLHVFLWNGDSEDAIELGYHYGTSYFMDRVRKIDFPLIEIEDKNVRVVATIDGVGHVYLDDNVTIVETYIILTPVSIDSR